jgi:hypothetical protein
MKSLGLFVVGFLVGTMAVNACSKKEETPVVLETPVAVDLDAGKDPVLEAKQLQQEVRELKEAVEKSQEAVDAGVAEQGVDAG